MERQHSPNTDPPGGSLPATNADVSTARHHAGVELIVEAVRLRGRARFRVRGVSMRPWLRAGDVLEVQRETLEAMRPGDLAVFTRAAGLFVHRVIGRCVRGGEPMLITKGDAFPEPDTPVSREELLGSVVRVARGRHNISLDAPARRALGKMLAGVSATMPWWYPGARALKRSLSRVL